MKYILRILILLVITLTTSSCFDNLYNLQIRGVILPDSKDCSSSYDIGSKNTMLSEEYSMMDLAYTKLAGSNTHNYSYLLGLGVVNVLDAQVKSRGEVNGYVNSIETKSVVVKTYTDQNVLIDTDVITKDVIIDPKTGAAILIPLFRNVQRWEGDNRSGYLYDIFYDNDGGELLTKYVTVDILINAETLSGEYASSNHFKFKINLCVDCLLCPKNSCTSRPDLGLDSLENSCKKRGIDTPTRFDSYCGRYQDGAPLCIDAAKQ